MLSGDFISPNLAWQSAAAISAVVLRCFVTLAGVFIALDAINFDQVACLPYSHSNGPESAAISFPVFRPLDELRNGLGSANAKTLCHVTAQFA